MLLQQQHVKKYVKNTEYDTLIPLLFCHNKNKYPYKRGTIVQH
jgi:hypothetical protein